MPLAVKVLEIIRAFVFKIFHLGMKSFISNGSYFKKYIYIKACLKLTIKYLIKKLSYELKYSGFFRNLYLSLEYQDMGGTWTGRSRSVRFSASDTG